MTRAVVIGGGLAGVGSAVALGKAGISTQLVDRNDYHQFQPLLYQVATSQLPARDVARPLGAIFDHLPAVEVVVSEVGEADLDAKTLRLADGRTLSGDFLVLAAGARANFFGIPGAAEHAFPLYSVVDAERLRLRLQDLLKASRDTADGSADTLDILIVGAGPTGVETAGAVAELLAAMKIEQAGARPAHVRIVDRGHVLLPQFSKKAHSYAMKQLTKRGVEPRLGVGVTEVREDSVQLDDGTTLPAQIVVWGGGESAATLAAAAGDRTGRGGRVDVKPDLSVAGFSGVYAVGDVANITTTDDGALPQLGSVAQQSGTWAAANILREMKGEATRPFSYKDKGIMAMIGRNAAVAEVGKHRHQVDGPVAFAAWLGVHAMLLSGGQSKTDAFLSWAWDYFDRDHASTLANQSEPQRIAWGDPRAYEPHINIDAAPVEG
jgi:NADH dehydrogenase